MFTSSGRPKCDLRLFVLCDWDYFSQNSCNSLTMRFVENPFLISSNTIQVTSTYTTSPLYALFLLSWELTILVSLIAKRQDIWLFLLLFLALVWSMLDINWAPRKLAFQPPYGAFLLMKFFDSYKWRDSYSCRSPASCQNAWKWSWTAFNLGSSQHKRSCLSCNNLKSISFPYKKAATCQ